MLDLETLQLLNLSKEARVKVSKKQSGTSAC